VAGTWLWCFYLRQITSNLVREHVYLGQRQGASKWGEIYDGDSDISMGICPENVPMWQFVTLAYLTHLQGK
jgi:hypothetical protein